MAQGVAGSSAQGAEGGGGRARRESPRWGPWPSTGSGYAPHQLSDLGQLTRLRLSGSTTRSNGKVAGSPPLSTF